MCDRSLKREINTQQITMKDLAAYWFNDSGWFYPDGEEANRQWVVDAWGRDCRRMMSSAYLCTVKPEKPVTDDVCFVCGEKHEGLLEGMYPAEAVEALHPSERWVIQEETVTEGWRKGEVIRKLVETPGAKMLAFHREIWRRLHEKDAEAAKNEDQARRLGFADNMEYMEAQRAAKRQAKRERKNFMRQAAGYAKELAAIERENAEWREAYEKRKRLEHD